MLHKIEKDGYGILVDAGSAHEKKMLDDGFKIDESYEHVASNGQGEIPSKPAPALPHPGNLFGGDKTSGNMIAVAAAEKTNREAADLKQFDADKVDADAKDERAKADAAKAAATVAAADARKSEAEAGAKKRKDAKDKFDKEAKAPKDPKTGKPATAMPAAVQSSGSVK